jgi:TPR repeat protein
MDIIYGELGISLLEDDLEGSFKYFKKSAELGNILAQRMIGIMYLHGKGVEQDLEKSIYWINESAKQGNIEAINLLNEPFYKGIATMFELSKNEDPEVYSNTCHYMGMMYFNGDSIVFKNNFKAFDCFYKAAQTGMTLSQYYLGLMYLDGLGVEQNYKEAFKWFLKAAEGGYLAAQRNVSIMYIKGEGVDKNIIEAYKWILISIDNGDNGSIEVKDYMEDEMTQEQISKAQKEFEKFKSLPQLYHLSLLGKRKHELEGKTK